MERIERMDGLDLELEVIAPLFLGGADPGAEARAASFKGLLRFWYRAADPDFDRPADPRRDKKNAPTREERLFGGSRAKAGQSGVLLRLDHGPLETRKWGDFDTRRFGKGSGTHSLNGLVYLGYPFQMRGNEERTAIAPGQTIRVRCRLPHPRAGAGAEASATHRQELRRAWTAAWWLLAHLGGTGSRSRRGFGALALRGWEARGEWPEIEGLPLLGNSADPAAWSAGLERGLGVLRGWYGDWQGRRAHHPHLGGAFRHVLLGQGFSAWDQALADLGLRMQEFRQRRAPDYRMVKDHLLAQARQGGRPLEAAPPRASFGLPLAFRYTSLRGPPLTLAPFDAAGPGTFERHGSLLLLRPVPIGGRLHGLYLRLDGDLPGRDPPTAVRGTSTPLAPAADNAMDRFLDSLTKTPG